MLEASQGVDFALEHPDARVIHDLPAAHDLHRDLALPVLLLGLVEDAHAPLAEFSEDSIRADHPRFVGPVPCRIVGRRPLGLVRASGRREGLFQVAG